VLIFHFNFDTMQLYSHLLSFASLLALVSAHAQILAAIGEDGSATSVGFQGK
jgi:vacuolar-type H+-ATPase subunit I/STV1